MADSREIGMRVGAATNQAVSVAVAFLDELGSDPTVIATYVGDLAAELLSVMDDLQATVLTKSGFAGTTQVAAPYVAPTAPAAAATPSSPNGYNTEFSGSTKPLKLHEHPELDGWLHAQAAAVGVSEVWDNRGKAPYITAIANKAAKTPPPFRSATDGIEKSFWPPK